jgi:TRAP-type C4-dicarboxylate transport system substrate-binding protein
MTSLSRRVALFVAGVLAVVLVAASAASATPDRGAGRTASVEWSFMTIQPATTKGHTSMGNFEQAFADEVFKKTNGALKITLRPPGELPYALNQTVTSVGQNLVQMGDAGVFSAGEAKVIGVFGLPFLISTPKQFVSAVKVLRSTLNQQLAQFGAQLLFYYTWPTQTVWGTGTPPKSLADLSGRKIRASSPEQADFLKDIGASPVTLTTPDVAPSLQRGLVDGVVTSGFTALGTGWGPLLKWGYMTPLGYVPGLIIVNKSQISSLPASVRSTLMKVAAKWQSKMLVQIPKAETIYRKALASQYGVKLVTGNTTADTKAGVKLMKPIWGSWASQNGLATQVKQLRKVLGK